MGNLSLPSAVRRLRSTIGDCFVARAGRERSGAGASQSHPESNAEKQKVALLGDCVAGGGFEPPTSGL